MTAPVGRRMHVDATTGDVSVRDATPEEVADIQQLRQDDATQGAQRDQYLQRLRAARRKIARALAAGQGAKVVTVADLAELFGIDPDPNA